MAKNKIFVGDNLLVMNDPNLSQFKNKVALIYIDPPYNNGSSFCYNNNIFKDYKQYMHTRLALAKEFMAEKSAIFVSIDDSEFANLKCILDEIFGSNNFVGTFITRQSQRSNAKHINTIHEYILCYAKNKKKLPEFKINRMDIPEQKKMIDALSQAVFNEFSSFGKEKATKLLQKLIKEICFSHNISWLKNYNLVDDDGRIFFAKDLSTPSVPREVNIPKINLFLKPLKTRGWSSDNKFIELYNNNRLCFKGTRPYEKQFLEEAQDSAPSILNFYSRQGTAALKKLGIYKLFDTPKPVELIKFLIRLVNPKNEYIMDFFAGSGTTAQAVYETNEEDCRNNGYILIQLNEKISEKSPVFKECKKLEIIPSMQYILKHRIDTFLKNKKISTDYDFFDA